jgi:hypothetical protein
MDKEDLKTKTDFICQQIWKILNYCEQKPEEDKKLQLWLVIHHELQKIVDLKTK